MGDETDTDLLTVSSSLHPSRRTSSHHDVSNLDDYEEDKDESDGEELGKLDQQKYMQPVMIKEHIEKLFKREKDLLTLMFGKYD